MTDAQRRSERAYYGGEGIPEQLDLRQISRRTAAVPPPAGVPFHVVVATSAQCAGADDLCRRTYPAYLGIVRTLSREWPEGRFTEAGSGHELALSDPDVVTAAVRDVLER